jgi:hypothetical protein
VEIGRGGKKGRRRKNEGRQIRWMCFVFVYENRTMKPIEIVLRRGEGDKGERWRG